MKQPVIVKPAGRLWRVQRKAAKRAIKVCETQAQAIQIGRRVAMNHGCELIVYRTDGTVRSKDSFGSDPFPPRSKDSGPH